MLNHGTITRTRITCKKSLTICATQLAGSVLLKKLKYFEVILSIFEFSHRVREIVRSYFLTEIIKKALFLAF